MFRGPFVGVDSQHCSCRLTTWHAANSRDSSCRLTACSLGEKLLRECTVGAAPTAGAASSSSSSESSPLRFERPFLPLPLAGAASASGASSSTSSLFPFFPFFAIVPMCAVDWLSRTGERSTAALRVCAAAWRDQRLCKGVCARNRRVCTLGASRVQAT